MAKKVIFIISGLSSVCWFSNLHIRVLYTFGKSLTYVQARNSKYSLKIWISRKCLAWKLQKKVQFWEWGESTFKNVLLFIETKVIQYLNSSPRTLLMEWSYTHCSLETETQVLGWKQFHNPKLKPCCDVLS